MPYHPPFDQRQADQFNCVLIEMGPKTEVADERTDSDVTTAGFVCLQHERDHLLRGSTKHFVWCVIEECIVQELFVESLKAKLFDAALIADRFRINAHAKYFNKFGPAPTSPNSLKVCAPITGNAIKHHYVNIADIYSDFESRSSYANGASCISKKDS